MLRLLNTNEIQLILGLAHYLISSIYWILISQFANAHWHSHSLRSCSFNFYFLLISFNLMLWTKWIMRSMYSGIHYYCIDVSAVWFDDAICLSETNCVLRIGLSDTVVEITNTVVLGGRLTGSLYIWFAGISAEKVSAPQPTSDP